MKWYKHDSSANMDAKLQSVILEYGAEGYGLYWYCLELIAASVDPDNLSFELEHDARIIAKNLGMGVQRCEEIMKFMVKLGLFEASNGMITCMKLAKRADDYTAKLVRSKLSQVVDNNQVLQSPTNSDKVQLDKNRLDKNRIESNSETPSGESTKVDNKKDAPPPCPYDKIIELYHINCRSLPRVKIMDEPRKKLMRDRWRQDVKHQSLEFWEQYFQYVNASDFLTGVTTNWNASLDWLFKPANFKKVIEGNYEENNKGSL